MKKNRIKPQRIIMHVYALYIAVTIFPFTVVYDALKENTIRMKRGLTYSINSMFL